MSGEDPGMEGMMHFDAQPPKDGLYDPQFEHDACGIGFIADMTGKATHETVKDAAVILTRLNHRGACGCEEETGDGAGMLIAIPDKLYRRVCPFPLPPLGEYSAGIVFFPKAYGNAQAAGKKIIEDAIAKFGQKLLGWRVVPVRPNEGKGLGATALSCEPHMEQVFVGFAAGVLPEQREPILYGIRSFARHAGERDLGGDKEFYICSLSSRVITYKGMLTSHQLTDYFADLEDPDCMSHVAMVHSRFATNTFPGWKRAHPYRFLTRRLKAALWFITCALRLGECHRLTSAHMRFQRLTHVFFRYMCHNGEINTVRGNKNWQAAREGVMKSDLMPELKNMCPIVEKEGSDSMAFDNVLELLIMAGRSLPEAVLMMMPEAWQNNEVMHEHRNAFYKFHASYADR